MFGFYAPVVALQCVAPLVLIGWVVRREPRRLTWGLKVAGAVAYFVAIAVAGLWVFVPWYTPAIYIGLLAAASARSFPRATMSPVRSPPREMIGVGAYTVVALASIALAAHALLGRRMPQVTAVDLMFPLQHGTYYIVNGGSVELVNAHLMTLTDSRLRGYRGQSYGIDILKLNGAGLRSRGVAPRDPREYFIFGDVVFSPCTGGVVRTDNSQPDLTPPNVDREHMAGNYVLLDCGSAQVLLGHLQRGTVEVSAGQRVSRETIIGRVGNSGNSNEPHLHVHAQRAGGLPFSGDPLPIRFENRYLVRNDRVTRAISQPARKSPRLQE